ncbi:putative acetyltransferase [Mumia flava]|uniref:Putative acetyltransferase n=1 Tax=Mumia flava TaxID=1348852 RepID=A0A0B2BT94_9ACTN|nr:GNAT family N-acetyltransferase [Mumia flava]PJJ57261.1 putative acetyltransferase [Mumia flava]
MEIRELDPDDLDAALDVRSRSFGPLPGAHHDLWRQMTGRAIAGRRQLAAYDGARVVATARINDFVQWWHGRPVRMAGVGGVVVAPEHRGRGASGALMRAVLVRSRELGYPLSALFPATVRPYRAVGYEIAGERQVVDLPSEALRRLAGDTSGLRRAAPSDARTVIDALGAGYAADRVDGPYTWAAEEVAADLEDDDVLGYLADDGFVGYEFDGGERLTVHELAAGSAATRRTLWSLVGSGSSVAPVVRAALAPRDPLWWWLDENQIQVQHREWWMLRVIDPVAAIAARGFPSGLVVEVPLVLDDPVLNDGGPTAYRLTVHDGAATLHPTETTDGIRLGPQGLAALFAGTSTGALRAAGLAQGGDRGQDAVLDAAFAAEPFMTVHF